MAKLVVGLSGGVDSSVAAYLLKAEGHEVIGCTMRTFDTERSLREAEDARAVAKKLGIPFYMIDYREEFKRDVIRYFISEYIYGRTPNPCCICNRKVKWQALLQCMREQGADYVATGHYAKVEQNKETGRYYLKRADMSGKDQSYALYNLTQEELSHTVMPLYAYTKEEVRALAETAGLFTAGKPDSQEICFIPDNDYAGFIKEHIALLSREEQEALKGLSWEQQGNYVDASGTVLGRHQGIIHYTVGQRKGLGIALGKRIFVKELRPLSNEVVLADDADVYTDALICSRVNFQASDFEEISKRDKDAALPALVRIRYADKGTDALITRIENETRKETGAGKAHTDGENRKKEIESKQEQPEAASYLIRFEQPVRAVTPGQAAVFYDKEGRLLGGGIIEAGQHSKNTEKP